MLSVRLDKNTLFRLDRLAKIHNRTRSSYVKEALEKFLEEQEEIDYAVAAYREFLEGDQKTYTVEEVMRESGMLDENS